MLHPSASFNVAITRAKEALVIGGSAEILARDPYWRGLLYFALRNGLYIGDFSAKFERRC